MQAFGTDRQAAKPRRIIDVGKRAPSGASAAHVLEAPKVLVAPCREANAERHGASMDINR